MAGKKGRSGRKRKPKPIEEGFKKNEERVSELIDIVYKLATDDSVSERVRIKAADLIIEKALPESQELSQHGLIITADDLELYQRKSNKNLRGESWQG